MSSFTKHNLLLEFASLKHACPAGVYVTLTPGDPTLWSGILFARAGPFAPAILRFQLSFPSNYPLTPPLVTFSTEIFHPLLTPLTTQMYASVQDVHLADEERLPPGGFSLRHGFPQWYGRTEAARSSTLVEVPVYKILDYLRASFNDEQFLNAIPLSVTANQGAYHAWHSFRKEQEMRAQKMSPTHRRAASKDNSAKSRQPGEWNWQGVWEDRLRKNVQASLNESVLYGSTNADSEIIRFLEMEEDFVRQVRDKITQSTALAA